MKRHFSVLIVLTVLPFTVLAGTAQHFDRPDTAYASNVAIDIIAHHGGVFLATSNGLNYTFDNGQSWLLYNSANGLPSNDISALLSMNGRLWVASNHSQVFQGSPLSFSDGLTYSDNDGLLWKHVAFDSLNPPLRNGTGPFRNIYDITGFHDVRRNRDWLFAACFAGGLIASLDNGVTWRRIYPTLADSVNYHGVVETNPPTDTSLTFANRAFSCVIDTSHGDSLFLWEGTVAGVFQYVFAARNEKFGTRKVGSISLCDSCTAAGGSFVFYGGAAGLARGRTTGGPYITTDTSESVSAVTTFGGRLFFGTFNPVSGNSTGLKFSNDEAQSFQTSSLTAVALSNYRVVDFAPVRNRLYVAAQGAGLFVSADTGNSWTHLWVDGSDTTILNLRNNVYSLLAVGDTLRLGTDSGLVTWFLNSTGVVDSSRNFVFPDNYTLYEYPRVVKIRRQQYGLGDTLTSNDSTALWLITRSYDTTIAPSGLQRSKDGGLNWSQFEQGVSTNDLGFVGDTSVVVSEFGVGYTADAFTFKALVVKDVVDSSIVMSDLTETLPHDKVRAIAVRGDTVILAGDSTFAVSVARMKLFHVFKPNLDSLKADEMFNYSYLNTLNRLGTSGLTVGMTGDFIPALGIKYSNTPGVPATLYASGRSNGIYGVDGVSYGRVVPDTAIDSTATRVDTIFGFRYRWDQLSQMSTFAWNFDHMGAPPHDTVLMPSDLGLFLGTSIGTADSAVTKFSFIDTLNREVVPEQASVFAARVVDSFLWIGTSKGTIRVKRSNLGDQQLTRVYDPSAEVYSYPAPFSPQEGGTVNFHFPMSKDGYVTVEVYDFALKLVARPIDHRFFAAGTHPAPHEVGLPVWDGHNGKGDVVAVGMYYFKITYDNGDVKWGKVAVIP